MSLQSNTLFDLLQFNDLLLLCNDMKLAVTGVIQRFRVKVVMEIDGLQVMVCFCLQIFSVFYQNKTFYDYKGI